jgi:arylsulfatase
MNQPINDRNKTIMKMKYPKLLAAALLCAVAFTSARAADAKKPNILIIWGDDVGMWNLSAYHRGMMGGSTPNIDRIAKEGDLTPNF